MNAELAKQFTEEWIDSWNQHDLSRILSHYADNLAFHSPFITSLKFNETGVISGKSELKDYFEIGLNAYPDLHFELQSYFLGINTLVIYYRSVNQKMAAEFFELDENGKAVNVYCHYSEGR